MLTEIENVRQVPDEGIRRWFMDKDMDLILWYEENSDKVVGFQISYDKRSVQRTVTWKTTEGGRSSLTCDGPYNRNRVIRLVEQNGTDLDRDILNFVLHRLRDKV